MEIAIAIISSGAIFGFIEFLIRRKDGKNKNESEILSRLKQIELSSTRTELILLMDLHPEQVQSVFTVAETYFVELKGDMYMSSKFAQYLKDNNIQPPMWFSR